MTITFIEFLYHRLFVFFKEFPITSVLSFHSFIKRAYQMNRRIIFIYTSYIRMMYDTLNVMLRFHLIRLEFQSVIQTLSELLSICKIMRVDLEGVV
jgi:hypothetical protein